MVQKLWFCCKLWRKSRLNTGIFFAMIQAFMQAFTYLFKLVVSTKVIQANQWNKFFTRLISSVTFLETIVTLNTIV